MKITSVRHGETKRNKAQIIQEPVRGKLSEEGINQARRLAERLSEEKFDKIYCSDAERTRQTAAEITKFHQNVPIVYVPELREMHAGEYIGKPWEEERKGRSSSPEGFARFKPKGGESIIEIVQRVRTFVNSVYQNHEGQHILFITHGGVNKALKHLAERGDCDPERMEGYEQDNCCVNIVEYKEGNLELRLYNCTQHL